MDDSSKPDLETPQATSIDSSDNNINGLIMNPGQNNDGFSREGPMNSIVPIVAGEPYVEEHLDSMNLGPNGGGGISQPLPPLPNYQQEPDEIVQVVYQSNQNGSMVGVGSSLLGSFEPGHYRGQLAGSQADLIQVAQQGQTGQQSRATSTLPSVAEEGSGGVAGGGGPINEQEYRAESCDGLDETTSRSISQRNDIFNSGGGDSKQQDYVYQNPDYNSDYGQQIQYGFEQPASNSVGPLNPDAIYSTINKQQARNSRGYNDDYDDGVEGDGDGQTIYSSNLPTEDRSSYNTNVYKHAPGSDQGGPVMSPVMENIGAQSECFASPLPAKHSIISELDEEHENHLKDHQIEANKENSDGQVEQANENMGEDTEDGKEEITHLFVRHKQGAAESGSFRNNFRRKNKLGVSVSVSTNEHELTAHRQKLLESQEANSAETEEEELGNLPKFKRTHSVSFNVSRGSRHSVDIRNLPSYLTVKRASIVDVAKGAMSSLMQSLGGSSQSSQRRDSSPDEEPIFEEPIAPTLSLGQRVALVKNSGAEFGTVGWIGQFPDVDDDWIVGVIFDNMIGDCDGAYNGVRYFYARQNYAMFVLLSSLTKTDNYIGRPETGTMLSRMSVSLKPGQLISIQRSSIRLQHCFLNAPHQRVGHDVRAVSNRLHCQCHNCGPCAHLTKQGRVSAIPPFGAHHAPNKKNSLAHAAVEILAHHHHHYHEEEHKHEDQYQFGDNAAHACNFVRYSCCQQNGLAGHNFSADCQMVRPELLDNLIHAPKAPHRRSRLRRRRAKNQAVAQLHQTVTDGITYDNNTRALGALDFNSTISSFEGNGTMKSLGESENQPDGSESSFSERSSSFSSSNADDGHYDDQQGPQSVINYQHDSSTYQTNYNNLYNTIDSQMSISDQRRFIYQRESSPFMHSPRSHLNDDYDGQNRSSVGSSIRRCLDCIMCRKKSKRRPKKRRLSAKARLIEYRRKQSTFVPSTLAKPQDDFASHGIIIPALNQPLPESNSDYSSYSKSSCSSPSKSPDHHQVEATNYTADHAISSQQNQQQSFTMEHGVPSYNEQLKSSHTYNGNQLNEQLNYGDYTFSDESYNKNGPFRSYESTFTDLGYYDSWTNSSNDTLKQMIDQTINEVVARPEPFIPEQFDANISPLSSNEPDNNPSEQVDISSPTVSLVDREVDAVSQQVGGLDLDGDINTHNQ